jgi:protein-S-isoprenylcysteine O-methyltransferase Ste14
MNISKHIKSLELKIPPLAITAGCAILIKITTLLTPTLVHPLPYINILTWATFLAGCLILSSALYRFKRAHTTVNPINPAQASHLQTQGIYRFTRNPMLTLISYAIYCHHMLTWCFPLLFIALINRLQIIPEERILQEKFGDAYKHYQQHTRRWI